MKRVRRNTLPAGAKLFSERLKAAGFMRRGWPAPGTRVQVAVVSGVNSEKTGVVIPSSSVKRSGRGVPELPGEYKAWDRKREHDEAFVKLDSGEVISMYRDRLWPIGVLEQSNPAIWYQIVPGPPAEIITSLEVATTIAAERSESYPFTVFVYRHGKEVASGEAPVASFKQGKRVSGNPIIKVPPQGPYGGTTARYYDSETGEEIPGPGEAARFDRSLLQGLRHPETRGTQEQDYRENPEMDGMTDREYVESQPHWEATLRSVRTNKLVAVMQTFRGGIYLRWIDYQGLMPAGATQTYSRDRLEKDIAQGIFEVIRRRNGSAENPAEDGRKSNFEWGILRTPKSALYPPGFKWEDPTYDPTMEEKEDKDTGSSENPATTSGGLIPKSRRAVIDRIFEGAERVAKTSSYSYDEMLGERRSSPSMGWIKEELFKFSFAKLRYNGSRKYSVNVHSNLWYDFESDVTPEEAIEAVKGKRTSNPSSGHFGRPQPSPGYVWAVQSNGPLGWYTEVWYTSLPKAKTEARRRSEDGTPFRVLHKNTGKIEGEYIKGEATTFRPEAGPPRWMNPSNPVPRMPDDDSPASVRRVADLVRLTTSLQTLHDAWAWAGDWNEGGDVWLPGDRAAGKPGIIGMIHNKLEKHGKSFDDLRRFESSSPYEKRRDKEGPEKGPTELTPVRDIPNYAVIIRATWERGAAQAEALEELKHRGLYLSEEQKMQAGLKEKNPDDEDRLPPDPADPYTLLESRAGTGMYIAKGKWHDPHEAREGILSSAWSRLTLGQERELSDTRDPKFKLHAGEWDLFDGSELPADIKREADAAWERAQKKLPGRRNPDVEGTYLASAREVKAGDTVVEADGFMWDVTATRYNNRRITLDLMPTYSSMTARGPRTLLLRSSASVRVLRKSPNSEENPASDWPTEMRQRIDALVQEWHEAERPYFEAHQSHLNYDRDRPKRVVYRTKYALLDASQGADSYVGYYAVDIADGNVYDIKAYGVPNKRKLIGNIRTLTGQQLSRRWLMNPAVHNPEPLSSDFGQDAAAQLSEAFHGRPAETVTTITEEVTDHDYLTELGDLVEIKVKTLSGYQAKIEFDTENPTKKVRLAVSPNGKQLYIEGGDQTLDLAAIKMDDDKWVKDKMVIGRIDELTYRTKKGFDGFKLTDYFHRLAEETKVHPMLVLDTLNDKLEVVGGQYDTQAAGIIN